MMLFPDRFCWLLWVTMASGCQWPPAACRGGPESWKSVLRLEAQRPGESLFDRMNVIARMSTLAASFCARLSVAPPCEMLSTKNKACDGWPRYIDVKYVGSPGISPISMAQRQKDAFVIDSRTTQDILDDYDEALKHASNRTIEWRIRVDYRDFRRPLQEKIDSSSLGITVSTTRRKARRLNITRCEYVTAGPSALSTSLADEFLKGVRLPMHFASLHLQTTKRCDTSLLAVSRYAACSLLPIELLLGSPTPRHIQFEGSLILFAPHEDRAYVKELVGALEATLVAVGNVRVVDGDTALRKSVSKSKKYADDPLLLLSTAIAVVRRAHFRLRLHETHCPSCDRKPIPQQGIIKSLASLVRERLEQVPRKYTTNLVPLSPPPPPPPPPVSSKKKHKKHSKNQKTSPPPPPPVSMWRHDSRELLSFACRTPVLEKKRLNTTVVVAGPRRRLRALTWFSLDPEQYDWKTMCPVSSPLRDFAAAFGAAFAPSAISRRLALVERTLPCDLVHHHARPSTETVEHFSLNISAEDFERLDIVFFPRPYLGVSRVHGTGCYYEADSVRSMMPPKRESQAWVLMNIDAPSPLEPAAFDPKFLSKFDLISGPHRGLFDIFVGNFPTNLDALSWRQAVYSRHSKKKSILAAFPKHPCPGESEHSVSGREIYATEIAAALGSDVDYIACGSTIDVAAARSYKFVLAFEIANCVSWVTAPLYTAFAAGAIPVYRGAIDARPHFVPNASAVVFAEDYKNPEELASHLKRVSKDKQLYLSYHAWRQYRYEAAFLKTLRETAPKDDFLESLIDSGRIVWEG